MVYKSPTCCYVTSRGMLPYSSADEASTELLAVHAPTWWSVHCEILGSTCGRSVRAGQRPPNVTRRRSTPT
eukprot:4839954-Prymnesium_polylepis.2